MNEVSPSVDALSYCVRQGREVLHAFGCAEMREKEKQSSWISMWENDKRVGLGKYVNLGVDEI